MTKYLETKRNSIEEAISSVVLGEKITKKELDRLEDQNEHGLLALKLAQSYGTPAEVKTIKDINKRHEQRGSISQADSKERNAIAAKYYRKVKEGFASDAQRRAAFAQGYKAKGKKDKSEELDEIFKDMKNPAVAKKLLKKYEKQLAGATTTQGKEKIKEIIKQLKQAMMKEQFELDEKIRTPQKLQRKMQLKKQTNFDFRLFDPEDSPGSDKANDDMNKEIVKASKMKDKNTAYQHMMKVQKKHSKHGATDTEPREMIRAILDRVFGESVELGEGYESEVLKVLNKADIDGYFKMGKLYVSRRDAKDAKRALEDSDEITKLPKMVMEDERMKKLTPRQRQALARVQAKPKSQVSLPKMPDFMKPKKEEKEMDIVETIRDMYEQVMYKFAAVDDKGKVVGMSVNRNFSIEMDAKKSNGKVVKLKSPMPQKQGDAMIGKMMKEKLDPVDKDAVKKKFDDRKDKDIDNDGDVDSTDKYLHKRRKAISKAISKEAYDIGKDYAQHTLDVTPGQGKKDVDKMLNTAYTKNQSMRETLAKVWGLDEGKSPFQKEEEKPLTKTMTGQKPTTVKVNPKIEEK